MKKIFIILCMFIPSFIFGSECDYDPEAEQTGDLFTDESELASNQKDFLQAGFTRINLSDLPDYLTKFFPHYDGGNPNGSNTTYLYKKDKIDTYGYIYISTKYCGTDNGLFINCPDKKYSIQFITEESEKYRTESMKLIGPSSLVYNSSWHAEGKLGFFLNPNEYDKIKKIYPNLEDVLNKKNNILLPVKISMSNVYYCDSTPQYGMFSISDITLLSGNESYIKATYEDICYGVEDLKSFKSVSASRKDYCSNYPNMIYTRTDDSYVNMRKKPNSSSEIIAKISPVFPKSDKYISRACWSLMKCNHDGNDKEISKVNDFLPYIPFLFLYHTPTLDWYAKILNDQEVHKDVKYNLNPGDVTGESVVYRRMGEEGIAKAIYEPRGEGIYLYTDGLPVNGWYKVFYVNYLDQLDNIKDRVYGYIHKSQLSWGY